MENNGNKKAMGKMVRFTKKRSHRKNSRII
jgi:hypothetical protein